MTATPLGGSFVTGSLAGSAVGRLRRRHVLGCGTAALRRGTGTATVARMARATPLLSALRLTRAGTRAGSLLGTRAASLDLLALGSSCASATGHPVVPAATRGLGRIGIGLHVVCHRDLELLGSKLDASRAALAVAAPRGLLLALVGRGTGSNGGLVLLGS